MPEPKILCLMTYGRAGSKFFHSLLDSHPQILNFPRTLLFDDYWQRVKHRKNDHEFLVKAFIEKHPRFFSGDIWYRYNKYDRSDQLGPDRKESFSVDVKLFRKNALAQMKGKEVNRQNLFIILHNAYHLACGKVLPEKPLILYHIHDIDNVDELKTCLSDFPNSTHLLVMARHPLQSVKSCLNWMKMHNVFSPEHLYFYQRQMIDGTSNLTKHFSELDIRVLPLEQLHLYHEEVMRALTEWLEIEWNDVLLKSTRLGKLWWGNGKTPRNGANPKLKIYQPTGILDKNNWEIICSLANQKMKRFSYINGSEMLSKRRRMSLLPRFILPTSVEMSSLLSILSVRHWYGVAQKSWQEICDPRFKGFDYLTRQQITQQETGNRALENKKRLLKAMRRHWRMSNPWIWFRFYIKRIMSNYKFFRNRREKAPKMLVEGAQLWQR